MGSKPAPNPAKLTGNLPLDPTIWPFTIVDTERGRKLIVHRTSLVLWSLGLLLGSWLSAATAGYLFNKYRAGNPEVRFTHMLLYPVKAKAHRDARAAYWLREGMKAFANNQWREAFDLLRMGLPRHPAYLDARFALARIYLAAQRPELASEVLVEGLDHHADQLDYVRTVFGLLFAQQADATVVELSRAWLARFPAGTPQRGMAVGAHITALYNRDRFAELLAFLEKEGVAQAPEARLFRARIAWEQGRDAEALATLRALVDSAPGNTEPYKTLADYLLASGAAAELRRLAFARQLAAPDEALPRLHFMEACALVGDRAAQEEAEGDFVAHFRAQPPALLALAEYAARRGRPALTSRLLEEKLLAGEPLVALQLHHIAALLEAGEAASAAQAARAAADLPAITPPQRVHLDCLRVIALAAHGKATEADAEVGALADSRYLTANGAYVTARRLLDLDRVNSARRLLERALELDPALQPAVEHLLRLELRSKPASELVPLIERFLAGRKPSIELIRQLRHEFESDRSLFVAGRDKLIARLVPRERTR